MSEDLSHDSHLRAALRHAPDHALTPPSGLTQTILAAARQAHRPSRAVSPQPPVRVTVARPRLLGWWLRWFASPRLAGGLATGLVAALGLGLWLDLGTEPAIEPPGAPPMQAERRADPVVGVPAPTAAAAGPAAQPVTTPAAPSDAAVTTAQAPAQAAPAARAKQPPTQPAAARGETSELLKSQRREAAATESRADTHAADAVAALPTKPAPPPASPPAALPAPAAADAAPPVKLAEAAAPTAVQTASAPDATAALLRQQAAIGDLRSSLAAGKAATAAGAGVAAEPIAAASPALTLLRRARSELAAGSARWSWQAPGASTMAPFDDDAQAWLLRVVQSARGRWADVAERAGAGEAIEVRWWRDDWPHATLRIEAEGLRWIEPSGRIRYAPLDAAALQRLRSP